MRRTIMAELARIAKDEQVTILFAIESGSRAWGFHSKDSDYDVRFVYARPVSWHLRLDATRDVIERPISGDLDISGWELGKALKLALASNAVLGEWLQSPITYLETPHRAALLDYCQTVLTRHRVGWHYAAIARRQFETLRNGDGMVRLKRYLYAIRPVLALRVMRLEGTAMPPMDMADLMARAEVPATIRDYIDKMIADKLVAGELGLVPETNESVDALIRSEMELADIWLRESAGPNPPSFCDLANWLHHTISIGVSDDHHPI
jgi:uncharacterized protein